MRPPLPGYPSLLEANFPSRGQGQPSSLSVYLSLSLSPCLPSSLSGYLLISVSLLLSEFWGPYTSLMC
jgi:hypothetical protein